MINNLTIGRISTVGVIAIISAIFFYVGETALGLFFVAFAIIIALITGS